MKVAVLDPDGAVTDPGTVRAPELDVSATTAPPAAAEALRFTVQVVDPPEPIEAGAHDRDVTLNGAGPWATVMLPPVAETANGAPAGDAASALPTPTVTFVALGVSVTVTTAATPFAILLVFIPDAMQM